MEYFLDRLEEAISGGHRILVFSQFVSMLKLVQEELRR
jgi:SNF2 family DNA or RNA helicase